MKQVKGILTMLLAICLFSACSSDDDEFTGTDKYEDYPTTLEGTWCLAMASYGWSGIHKYADGEVIVNFYTNHTMQVIKKDEKIKAFLNSGFYPYEIIKTETDKYNGNVYTTISIDGIKCTYWFKDGMMTLDFGMAVDGPGYFFKKLRGTI